jgi:hypothetical protein
MAAKSFDRTSSCNPKALKQVRTPLHDSLIGVFRINSSCHTRSAWARMGKLKEVNNRLKPEHTTITYKKPRVTVAPERK